MGPEDDTLAQNLVAPESVDNPDREWTKGEEQPRGCRDAWAAILFYAQFIGIAVVAGWLGVPAVTRQLDDSDQQASTNGWNNVDYSGMMYLVMASSACAFVVSGISLGIMSCCPKILIQLSLLTSLAVALAVCIWSFMYGSIIGGVFGAIFFLLSLCYAWAVWRRIPFAAANLQTGLTAVKKNAFIFILAYMFVALTFGKFEELHTFDNFLLCSDFIPYYFSPGYACLWMTALVGVFDSENSIDEKGNVSTDEIEWLYFFLLLLALFWSEQVFQNTMHAIVAGVVSTWWFVPEEASCCCSKAIWGSTIRATTTSFGSICFGSLLVAIIQTIRSMVEAARNDDDVEGCAAFLLCLVDCCLACLEGILEYFNKFAYIYVGMYGYSYLEAGKNVMTLFKQKGWTVIINDDLISNTLSLFNLVVGALVGAFGLAMYEANPEWLASIDDQTAAQGAAFGFPFLIGIVVSAVMFSVVDSSVNTVIVCFAEGPAEFEENHPELSSQMREAWRKVYPAECGF
eukprot:CCRYP_003782-RB/>CCRYP_003782-RB protein AED:0.24 eAED:0.24 QI:507/1/1/1/0.8/0.66/6/419/513